MGSKLTTVVTVTLAGGYFVMHLDAKVHMSLSFDLYCVIRFADMYVYRLSK